MKTTEVPKHAAIIVMLLPLPPPLLLLLFCRCLLLLVMTWILPLVFRSSYCLDLPCLPAHAYATMQTDLFPHAAHVDDPKMTARLPAPQMKETTYHNVKHLTFKTPFSRSAVQAASRERSTATTMQASAPTTEALTAAGGPAEGSGKQLRASSPRS